MLLRSFILITVILLPLSARADEITKAPLFTLSYAEAEEALGRALADKGAAEKVAAFINGRKNEALFSYTKPLEVQIRGLQFDKPSGHWSASLLAISGSEIVTAIPSSGRYDELAEIPMLKHVVKNGEIIKADDIEIRDIAVSQTRSDIVTDMAGLIDKSPVYSITAGRPIRMHEIAVPPLVKKNSIVQMHYHSPGMEISTTGQAMEDGIKGVTISVKNLTSKKIIQAVVDDVASVNIVTPDDSHAEHSAAGVKDLYATN
jgi:flagellar basal body P-ring formation protein FlgA